FHSTFLYVLSPSCRFFTICFLTPTNDIRYATVTGVQTCALPICQYSRCAKRPLARQCHALDRRGGAAWQAAAIILPRRAFPQGQIGRASCRERVEDSVVAGCSIRDRRKERARD